MSRPKNDRKVQSESGKTFQDPDTESFVRAIAGALKAEFGATPSALKTVAQLTHSNERTVRNWLEGKNGPTGVLGTVLELADRRDLGLAVETYSTDFIIPQEIAWLSISRSRSA